MTFKEYVEGAMKTSTFKKKEKAISCGLFGLAGEVNEYLCNMDEIDELGDVFWYIALLSKTIGITPEKVDNYSTISEDTSIVIDELQEVAKKIYRDYDYDFESLPDSLYDKFIIRFNIIYSNAINEAITVFKMPQKVWERNLEKLADRMERNVIHGEGDKR